MKLYFFKKIIILLISFIIIFLFVYINILDNSKYIELYLYNPAQNDFFQIYYDIGRGFNEADSIKSYPIKKGKLYYCIFKLPKKAIRNIKVDIGNKEGLVKVDSIWLKTKYIPIYKWNASSIFYNFAPFNNIDGYSFVKNILYIRSNGKDPSIVYRYNYRSFYLWMLFLNIFIQVVVLIFFLLLINIVFSLFSRENQ